MTSLCMVQAPPPAGGLPRLPSEDPLRSRSKGILSWACTRKQGIRCFGALPVQSRSSKNKVVSACKFGRILLLTAPHCSPLLLTAPDCSPLLPTAPHCSPLLPTAPHCSRLLPTAPHCSPLLLTAPHCSQRLQTMEPRHGMVLACALTHWRSWLSSKAARANHNPRRLNHNQKHAGFH